MIYKRILAFLILLLLVSQTVFADTAAFETANDFLKAAGIMEVDTDDAAKGITRAQFAKQICVLLGFGESDVDSAGSDNSDKFTGYWTETDDDDGWNWIGEQGIAEEVKPQTMTPFYDVKSDDENWPYIEKMASLGIMNGNGGYFDPERMITNDEAVKIMVVLLNADITVKAAYPEGYRTAAAKLGILDSVTDYDGSARLKRENAAIMIYNTLHSEYYSADSYSANGGGLEENGIRKYKDRLLMEKLLGVYKTEGLVTSNGVTSIDNDKIKSDSITIDGVEYENGLAESKNLLGRWVTAYYTEKRGKDRIFFADASNSRNKTVTVDAEDIVDFSGGTLTYYQNEKKKTAYISAGTDVIYNDQLTESYTKECFDIDEGKVTLLDNNSDGKYEVVFIDKYTIMVVGAIDTSGKAIYDKYKKELVIDYDNAEMTVTDYQGNAQEIESIKTGDVIAVKDSLESQREKIVSVTVSAKTASGEVTSYDKVNKLLKIGDKSYELSHRFENPQKYVGSNGKFHLDPFGKIVYSGASSDLEYGYIIAGEKNSGLAGGYKLKIFCTDGEIREYNMRDKVKFNGTRKDDSDVIAALGSENICQLVRFSANGDLEITEILQPDVDKDKFVKTFSGTTTGTYRPGAGGFITSKPIAFTDSETVIMNIPLNEKNDESGYFIRTGIAKDSKLTLNEIYKEKESMAAADVIITYTDDVGGNSIKQSIGVLLVKQISKAIFEDGEEGYKITGYYNGVETSYKCISDKIRPYMETTAPGDLIRLENDSKGYVKNYEKIFDEKTRTMCSGTNPQSSSSTSFIAEFYALHGKVWSKYYDEGYICIAPYIYEDNEKKGLNTDSDGLFPLDASMYAVQVYDRENEEAYIGKLSEIIDAESTGNGTEVVLYSFWSDAKSITLYK